MKSSKEFRDKYGMPRWVFASAVGFIAALSLTARAQYDALMHSNPTATFELFDQNAADQNMSSRSLAGLAISAYLNGLQSDKTSEKDVSNHGKNLQTTISLDGGRTAVLGVNSTSSRKYKNGPRVPSADDAYLVTVGEIDPDGFTRTYTFTRNNETYDSWDLSDVMSSPNSAIDHAVVVSPNAYGRPSTITSFNMDGNQVIGGSNIVHSTGDAAQFYHSDVQRAACIADIALQATNGLIVIN